MRQHYRKSAFTLANLEKFGPTLEAFGVRPGVAITADLSILQRLLLVCRRDLKLFRLKV